jgi:hypothetical protein
MERPHATSRRPAIGALIAVLLLSTTSLSAAQDARPTYKQAERAIHHAMEDMYDLYMESARSFVARGACDEHAGEDCFGGERECPYCLWKPDTVQMRRLGAIYDSAAAYVYRAESGARPELLDWLAGQRVGVWARSGYLANARWAAQECLATLWWCEALLAYVDHLAGQHVESEERFRRVLEAMPAEDACEWNDLEFFHDSLAFAIGRGRSGPCLPYELTEALWALADPLFSRPGNDRMTEHYARQVDIEIHRQFLDAIRAELLPADRSTLLVRGSPDGGLIINGAHNSRHQSLLVRYGWPTGIEVGAPIAETLGSLRRRLNNPVANLKLTYGRSGQSFLVTMPLAEALTARAEQLEPGTARAGEAYRAPYGPVEPWQLQTGFFRRAGEQVLLVRSATPLLRTPATDAWRVVSWDGIDFADAPVIVNADTLIAWLSTPWKIQVVSLEAVHGSGAWRARSGTRPPAAGVNAAVSSVLLLEAATDHPENLEEAARRALPTTRIGHDASIAAYWELYVAEKRNVAVDVAVRFVDRPGFLGRLLGPGSPPPERRIRWEEEMEPRAGVAPRAVDLDLGALPSGNYEIEVTLVLHDGEVLRSAARFRIDG